MRRNVHFARSLSALVGIAALAGCSEYDLTQKEVPVEPGIPKIEVKPGAIDFGMLAAGTEVQGFFQIENIGAATLALGDLSINGSSAFVLNSQASGTDLEPGDVVDAMVVYTATGAVDTGTVVIPSDDPETPKAKVQLNGGVTSADKPVAICSVDPPQVEAINGSATLVGDQSYDPGGLAITEVSWNGVLRPNGSQATVPVAPPSQPNRPGFNPDMVGTYGFELIVTNEAGIVSDPCYAELEAIPADDLWVEMFWTNSGDDMDLHLTRDGGALRSGQDCYFANCVGGRDWGTAGAANNPALDLDDIPGTGPENINVNSPENVMYGVYVHDYPGSVFAGSNSVTVNIYLSGSLAWTDTRAISGEDSDNHYADVDWAAQTVIPR